MRLSQLQLLDDSEISLLLYVVNVLDPIQSPKVDMENPKNILWIRHDALLWKLSQHHSKLTESGKEVFKSLMTKLNKSPVQEHIDYEHSTNTTLTQSEFQF